ncbi:hypothetical protein MHUMG1_01093 [Metarhizium humberi]|uniref:Heterokaryon incompatibility domain-containing protein n=1 Tax=Metarhizium humberi TaxID=2596975 RepID=A0A9P8MGY9_9HYPO|nr:hypothetical protein MHUMG1_01093 [Metarhizium humberi]
MSACTYRYAALAAGSIRLLQLQPHTDEQSRIQIQIFEYSLLNSAKGTHLYEALSYVWGSAERTEYISTADGDLCITKNLHEALSGLRDHAIPRIIWADAVCINQDDADERGRQVQLMAEIYARATRVIVWLEHPPINDSAIEMETSSVVYRAFQDLGNAASGPIEPSNIEVDHAAIRRVLQASWFERIWILQEVAAARHVLIMCQNCVVDGDAFCAGLDALSRTLENAVVQNRLLSAVYLIKSAGLRSKQLPNFSKHFSLDICTLGELVDMYHNRKATDIRDKVYALLGMSNDKPDDLLPDYKISWNILFRRLIQYLIGNQAVIETWDNKETVVLKGKGYVLGKVVSLPTARLWDTDQDMDVELYLGNGPFNLPYWRRWTLRVSAKAVQEGDIICLLEGSSKPTIVRIREDYCAIIAIAVSPRIAEPTRGESLDWPRCLKRIKAFPHTLLLIWDWEVSWEAGRCVDDYRDFLCSRIIPRLEMETGEYAAKANRLHDVGKLLGCAKRFGDAVKTFRKAVEMYEMARGGVVSLPTFDVASEAEGSPQAQAEQWLIMASIWGQKGDFTTEYGFSRIARSIGHSMMRLFLDRYGDEIAITEKAVEAAAQNEAGAEVMELLFDRYRDAIVVTEKALKAAVGNDAGTGVLDLFLDRRRDQIAVTEEVMEAAARNRRHGGQVMRLLLEQFGDGIIITENIFKEAIRNVWTGREVLRLLIHRPRDKVPLTERILVLAAGDELWGKDVMGFFLAHHVDQMCVSEKVVEAAAGNVRWGSEILDLLFSRNGDWIVVNEKVLKAAAQNRHCGKRVLEVLERKRPK